jgi:hypothetical protein
MSQASPTRTAQIATQNVDVARLHGPIPALQRVLLRAMICTCFGALLQARGAVLQALECRLAEGEIGAARPVGAVAGVQVGCFPDLYAALEGNPPEHVITL